MKRFIKTYLLLLLTVPFFVQGQQQSVLWEISGNGLSKKSYLFGTIHIVPYKIIDSFPAIKKIIRSTTLAFFESTDDLQNSGSGNLQTRYSPPLDSVFTKEEYRLVDSFFSRTEFGSIRDHNKDADLFTMLQVTMTLLQDFKINKRLDEYLIEFANDSAKIKKASLDKKEEGEKYIAQLTSSKKLAELIVNVIRQGKDIFDSYVATYKTSLTSDLMMNEQDMNYKTVIERNKNWVRTIEPAIQKEACFIAVGLGHLEYNTGLIVLLKNKGYILKPVDLKKHS